MTEKLTNKLLEKINKLLAMANDAGASDTERETAMRQAHGILAKHNLDMAAINDVNAKGGRDIHQVIAKKHQWACRVADAIAKLYFCEYLIGSSNANYSQHLFVGKTDNCAVAIAMFQYLVKSLMSDSRKYVKRNNITESPYKAEMDFLKGASYSISTNARKIREQKEAEMRDPSSGTALVLADYYKQEQEANDEWIKQHLGQIKHRNGRKDNGEVTEAHLKGYQHGAKINLSHSISDKTTNNAAIHV